MLVQVLSHIREQKNKVRDAAKEQWQKVHRIENASLAMEKFGPDLTPPKSKAAHRCAAHKQCNIF